MKLNGLIQTIAEIHARSQDSVGQALNRVLTLRNWLIGAWIVEYEQDGEDRAAYGDRALHRLAQGLGEAGVRGLGQSNLKNCRQVALAYPELDPRRIAAGLLPYDSMAIGQTSGELAASPRTRSPPCTLVRRPPRPWTGETAPGCRDYSPR